MKKSKSLRKLSLGTRVYYFNKNDFVAGNHIREVEFVARRKSPYSGKYTYFFRDPNDAEFQVQIPVLTLGDPTWTPCLFLTRSEAEAMAVAQVCA